MSNDASLFPKKRAPRVSARALAIENAQQNKRTFDARLAVYRSVLNRKYNK